MHQSLAQDIILYRRGYFRDKVKSPLLRVVSVLVRGPNKIRLFLAVWSATRAMSRYPEPTKENCSNPLTLALMDVWDEFLQWENNPGRKPLFQVLRRLSLCEVEHDTYYRQRFHWFCKKLMEAYPNRFPELLPTTPDRRVCWNEPVKEEDLFRFLKEDRC